MEQIKDTILNLMQKLDEKKRQPYGGDPREAIKKILTKKELRHIKINYFNKGVLGVNVDSSSWLHALTLRKEDILKKLQNDFSSIKDVCFRIGEIE